VWPDIFTDEHTFIKEECSNARNGWIQIHRIRNSSGECERDVILARLNQTVETSTSTDRKRKIKSPGRAI